MSRPIKIIAWTTIEDLDKKEDEKKKYNSLDMDNQQNRQYYMQYVFPYITECDFNEFHEDVLIKELIEKEYIICGDTHQRKAIPIFEDGYLLLSMRKWAEIMQKVWENKKGYTNKVPNFYMASLLYEISERLPNE